MAVPNWATGPRRRPERIIPQWQIEAAFLPNGEMCLERIQFAKADKGRESADGGFAMRRGMLTGEMIQGQLWGFGETGAFAIDLGEEADRQIAKLRLAREFPSDRLAEMRAFAIEKVRQWQASFPPDDGQLDWANSKNLLLPQTDLLIRR